jgi:membrane protease YdiL (CAAX protease family)
MVNAIVSHLQHVPPQQAHLNDGRIVFLVVVELLALTLVYGIGRARGWSFATFGLQVTWPLTGLGLILFVVTLISAVILAATLHVIRPLETTQQLTGEVTLPFVLLVMMVNPFFEEVLEVGYFAHVFQRYGMWATVLASAFFRAALHAYLGVNATLSLFLIGFIFGLAYWRWRQLWPLILAHVIMDFVFMLPVIH